MQAAQGDEDLETGFAKTPDVSWASHHGWEFHGAEVQNFNPNHSSAPKQNCVGQKQLHELSFSPRF